MSTPIRMPQLGESVAEGTIGRWLKQPGDWVARDEPIAEIITDKVNAELPPPVAGQVEALLVAEGGTVAVGQEIACVAESAAPGSGSNGAGGVSGGASPVTERAPQPPAESAAGGLSAPAGAAPS